MIMQIQRNDWQFNIPEYAFENLYLRGIHNGRAYANCQIQMINDIAYTHLYIDHMTLTELKTMKKDLPRLKEIVKNMGAKRIIGVHDMEGAEKWEKFLRLVGFHTVKDHYSYEGKQYRMTEMEV